MSFKPGGNVGPYRVMEQLGQGGMASVYKAYHAALDRYVALKVLHQAFNEDSTFIGRFQREARVVAKLEHPNIVPVYDYAEHEGRPYLVMKFIEGDTLKARMNAGSLSWVEIEQVVESVGSALGYAHRQGVLHRDIKPSNVLISAEHVMYLADFGLARIAVAGESTLSTDSVMGTPQYISPEQAMGKKDLDGRTDIYSFGVMLYEMVVGQVPFNADTPFSIIHDHIYTPLPLPKSVNPNVPDVVQRVLLKALAKDRDDRYQTVEELIAAFKSAWLEAGVPMRGADVRMEPGAMKAGAATLQTQVPGVETAPVENLLKSQNKRRGGWFWVAVGLVTILCFVFGLFALRNTFPRLVRRGAETSTPLTAVATLGPMGQVQPVPSGGLVAPTLIPVDQLTPEIEKAYAQVQANPGDPNAHLQLSLAFWDAGLDPSANDEYMQAFKLAGLNNEKFYLSAVQEYGAREAWHLAAGTYLRLVSFYISQDKAIPDSIRGGFREAAYKGAQRSDLPLVMPFDQLNDVQAGFANIVRGRHVLYNGELSNAEELLRLADKPTGVALPEIHLLKAEIAIQKGNSEEARNILLTLGADPNMPEWVRIMADEILKSIQ
jgi:tRNA A-37 threonylcarbamoyl transferase component Bud32